jgi:hypothetical protein
MNRPTDKSKSATPSAGKPTGAFRRMPRIARIGQRLGSMIPDEELRGIPKDLSSQIDHYVYGTPKR